MTSSRPFLQVDQLTAGYPRRQGLRRRRTYAVDNVSFDIAKGRTLGLVGESGCGKTTLARALLRLIEPDAGRVLLDGKALAELSPRGLRAERRHMQIIFQDADTALSPRRTVGQSLLEPLHIQAIGKRQSRHERVEKWLEHVGLSGAFVHRYPHELSTGQRQRVAIARAFILHPGFVVADEPVSALDANLRQHIVRLLKDLQRRFGTTMLFISHDLAVVREISDEVAVMYRGRIVEQATTPDLYLNPRHPYTQLLMNQANINRANTSPSHAWHRQTPETPD